MNDIPKLAKEDKLFVGKESVLKNLKVGKVKRVFISSNCPAPLREEVEHCASLGDIEIEQLDVPNDELGVVCKKQFSISILGLKE